MMAEFCLLLYEIVNYIVLSLNPSIRLSLQDQKPVCRVDIAWADGNPRVYKFYIEVSTDAQNWQSAFNGKSSGSITDFEPYTFNGMQL